jgi:hypothetical protein
MLLCVSGPSVGSALWSDLLDALDAVTPLIDDAAPGLAFLDMRGIAGTPASWIAGARAVLQHFPAGFALGAGSNKFCARAAARMADGTVCTPGGERAFVAPLGLELLELDAGVRDRLRLLGIDSLGDLAQLPHGPFVRRFGPQAARWHAWARGEDATPFVPRAHAVAIEAAIFGEGHADDEAQVIFAVRVLLARVCCDLERCGKRAGCLVLDVELEDAQTRSFEVALAAPTAAERAMLDVLRAKLEGATFSAAIVGLRLRAGRLEEGGEAVTLFAGGEVDAQAIAVTIARLEAVLGEPVRRARTHSAHALEERFTYDRFEPPAHAWRAEELCALTAPAGALVPQLRLLAVTEIAVTIREGEPSQIGSRAVVECAGPWRIELGWFAPDDAIARDEYDVLLEDGELYRIYRQGTHWYLRGAYD